VVLRLRFKADLFPFFPPSVELVRPRLHGAARSALASHPLLRLSNWDPMTGAAALLERLRRFLERTARVDMDCAANDPRGAPQGAHSDPISLLHGALVQLGALHSLTAADDEPLHARDAAEEGAEAAVAGARAPAAASLPAMPRHLQPQRLGSGAAAMDTEPPAALKSEGEEEEEEEGEEEDGDDELDMMDAVGAEAGAGSPGGGRKRKLAGWAPGTGYGYDGGGGRVEDRWDPAKTKAAQEAQDEATQRLTVGVTELVHAAWAAGEPTAAAAAAVVASSVLAPFLARELRGLSIMDMAARLPYYTALVRCLLAVAHSPAACRGGGFEAVLAVLAQVEAQAHMFTRLSARGVAERQQQGESSGAAGGSAQPPRSAIAPPPVTSATAAASAAASAAAGASEAEALALVVQAAETLRGTLRAPRPHADAPAAPAAAEGDEAEAYVRALAPLGLDACATLSGEHHYRKDASDNASPAQVRRVAKECAALAALLPCSPSSSVFVRAEEASTSLWRALVTGPEVRAGGAARGAPSLAAGDAVRGRHIPLRLFLPRLLPLHAAQGEPVHHGRRQDPLQVRPGGRSAFRRLTPRSPNLYNCGKVCLSLLGTWHGAKGEGWDPNASSALQVRGLASAESLCLPYSCTGARQHPVAHLRG